MRLQDYLIAIIISGLFITLPLGYLYFAYDEMGVVVDDKVNQSFGRIQSIAVQSNKQMINMTSDIQSRSPGGKDVNANTDQTYEDNLLKASARVLSLIPQSYSIMSNSIQILGIDLGIHPLILSAAFMILIIILSFLFISAVIRQRV